jgi:competence protein ComFC
LALPLGDLLANGVNAESRRPEKDFILMPVPLYKKRLLERGFNQAALLAGGLSDRLGLEVEEKVLERVRQTVPQVDLEEKERKDNVKNVFSVRDISRVKNKKIILVDDVITTGATIEECGKVLKLSGAKEVWGVALAKG